MNSRVKALTLMDAVFPRATLVRDLCLVLGFGLITALCARIAFWIGPVPITGQTFAVLLAGILLGSRLGALSQVSYLALGAIGLPVFAGGFSGVAYMLGPTGGYLMGFVLAAFVVGLLAERGWDRHFFTAALAMLVGSVVIYASGIAWLSHFLTGKAALEAGLYPFLPGDAIKVVLAAMALPLGWKLLRRGE